MVSSISLRRASMAIFGLDVVKRCFAYSAVYRGDIFIRFKAHTEVANFT